MAITSRPNSHTGHVTINFGRESLGLNGTEVDSANLSFEYGYPTWASTIASYFNNSSIVNTVNVDLARGNGLSGVSVDLALDPNGFVDMHGSVIDPTSTEVRVGTISVAGAFMGLSAGTEVEVYYTKDKLSGDLDIGVNIENIFAGLAVIAGEYYEAEGMGFGGAVEGRAGFLVDETGIYLINDVEAVVGLGILGHASLPSVEGILKVAGPDIVPVTRECFLSGTLVDMWPKGKSPQRSVNGIYDEHRIRRNIWRKSIEDIKAGDVVVSYDANGHLKPGTVTQTSKNSVTHVLDFWGIGITPGHATLCGAGEFEGQHVPIMDILRTDGAIVRDDGTLVRAATCCEVGSAGDQFVHVILGDKQPDGRIKIKEHAELRLGTRIILDDGRDVSLQDVIEAKGGTLTEDGYVQDQNGAKQPFWWTYGESLPKPEDYILKRSDVELEAIYIAGEWESIGTQLTAPADRLAYLAGYKPSPNIPPAFKDRPDAPRAVSVLKPH